MQKEKLTKELIAEDLDRYAKWNCTTQDDRPFWGMTSSALLAVLCGFLVRPWVAIPFAVLSVGMLVWFLLVNHRFGNARKKIRERSFTVSSATLTSITEETARNPHNRGNSKWISAHFLYFGGEQYRLYEGLYPWSKDFHMSIKGMLHTSIPGDEFWVARDSETEEIGAVYNKKFFDYEP